MQSSLRQADLCRRGLARRYALLKDIFARVERIGEVQRKRGPLVIETYALDLLEGAKGDVLDRSPPPELR